MKGLVQPFADNANRHASAADALSSMSTEMAMRCALSLAEKDEALRVLGLVGDRVRELATVVRVVGVEPLGDEVRVRPVLGEDDRLAEPVTARDLQLDLGPIEVGEQLLDERENGLMSRDR